MILLAKGKHLSVLYKIILWLKITYGIQFTHDR